MNLSGSSHHSIIFDLPGGLCLLWLKTTIASAEGISFGLNLCHGYSANLLNNSATRPLLKNVRNKVVNNNENTELERRSDSITVSPNPIAIFRINEQENYEQNLFGAISATLDKAPKSSFTLVAVSSSAGNPSEQAERAANARNNVSKLINTLVSMGMPVDRISVSSLSVADVENTEVRLYAD